MKPFEVLNIELKGSNLIEASAGTGKTYSIGILALRLIASGVPVEKLLMVTFTRAAVAELESRVRDFIRQAWLYSTGAQIKDETIRQVVDQASKTADPEEIRKRLYRALLLLDDASILTIHGFCQRVLTEYAFETGQIFSAEISSGDTAGLEEAVNLFWRTKVTGLPAGLIGKMIERGFTRTALKNQVKLAQGGKKIPPPPPQVITITEENCIAEMSQAYQQVFADYENLKNSIIQRLDNERIELFKKADKTSRFNKNLLDPIWWSSKEKAFELLNKIDQSTKYGVAVFGHYFDDLETLNNLFADRLDGLFQSFFRFALSEIVQVIDARRLRENTVTFDALIGRLHDAITGPRAAALVAALHKKYHAAFIDEFQDTDREQYVIFKTLFNVPEKIIFYIGDPKQSIYAFRKADIFTYFKAQHDVDQCYSMNVNYRSSDKMVHAFNKFFLPQSDFTTFGFDPNEKPRIDYIEVQPSPSAAEGQLYWRGQPADPMHIFNMSNKDQSAKQTADTIATLISSEEWMILKDKKLRRILPADFGILVYAKDEAIAIRRQLAVYNIPAVTIDETQILQTREAKEIAYVLEAALDPALPAVRKALLTSLTQIKIDAVQNLDEEWLLKKFRGYQKLWAEKGVFVMLSVFSTDFNVRQKLIRSSDPLSGRQLSNLGQMMEVLHGMETDNAYSPAELVTWLQKGINGGVDENDEYVLRIESDEAAVRIVTIHKSKGLEYNIVILPHLDFVIKDSSSKKQDVRLLSFRNPQDSEYYFSIKDWMTDDQMMWFYRESEQEKRRLLYVALTRAKYGCFINSTKSSKTTLSKFLEVIESNPADAAAAGIVLDAGPLAPSENYRYAPAADPASFVVQPPAHFELMQANWKKLSYTYLSLGKMQPAPRAVRRQDNAYDQFIFQDLPKGALTGNLLHYIFEHIDFSNPANWSRVIEQAQRRLSFKKEGIDAGILKMLEMVTRVNIKVGSAPEFSLASVKQSDRLNELEFDFNVKPFHTLDILSLSDDQVRLQVKDESAVEGMMNGKIDLFFCSGNQYFLLDWKSNFLGDAVTDYDADGVAEAMQANNYHLQYHIYALAVYKYLKARLPDFNYERDFGGVIYLFLRGVREGSTAGIFVSKPPLKKILALQAMLDTKVELPA
jgi:exodeoxyribonuclease V beta subunit